MNIQNEIFHRTALLVGEQAMDVIQQKRVIIFGVGGVGSWVAESLVRSGIMQLTIVDSDTVSVTNVNRQCPATTRTVGMVKVEAMKDRLLEINPEAKVEAVQAFYSIETAASFHLEDYDYIIDAIDSLEHKAALIRHATSLPPSVKFFSSMGAALKMDPTKIRVDEFWKVKGCPLARALRQKFKHSRKYPGRKFRVVYSSELLTNRGTIQPDADNSGMFHKTVNGTMAHTTAIFGFTLAGLVIQDIVT